MGEERLRPRGEIGLCVGCSYKALSLAMSIEGGVWRWLEGDSVWWWSFVCRYVGSLDIVVLSLVLATLRASVVAVALVLVALSLTLSLALVVEPVGSALAPCVTTVSRQRAWVGVLDSVVVTVVVVTVPVTISLVVVAVVVVGAAIVPVSCSTLAVSVVVAISLVVTTVVTTVSTSAVVASSVAIVLLTTIVVVALVVSWDKRVLDRLSVHVSSHILNDGVVNG